MVPSCRVMGVVAIGLYAQVISPMGGRDHGIGTPRCVMARVLPDGGTAGDEQYGTGMGR